MVSEVRNAKGGSNDWPLPVGKYFGIPVFATGRSGY